MSNFNTRFTELVNQVNGTSMTDRLTKVAKGTYINPKYLRKYYLAPGDKKEDEAKKIENKNRVLAPDPQSGHLERIAEYFGVSPDYLMGDTETKVEIKSALQKLIEDEERNTNIVIEEGLLQARNSKYWYIYKTALDWLLTDLIAESTGKRDEDNPEFLLLYYIGRYIQPLRFEKITVPHDVIEEAMLLSKHTDLTKAQVKQLLSSLTNEYAVDTTADNSRYLEQIIDQLKIIKESAQPGQKAALTVIKHEAEERGGSCTVVDDEQTPAVRKAMDCGAYDLEYPEK